MENKWIFLLILIGIGLYYYVIPRLKKSTAPTLPKKRILWIVATVASICLVIALGVYLFKKWKSNKKEKASSRQEQVYNPTVVRSDRRSNVYTLPPADIPVDTTYTIKLAPNVENKNPWILQSGEHYDGTPSANMKMFVHYPTGEVYQFDIGPNKETIIARADGMYFTYISTDSATVDVKILH